MFGEGGNRRNYLLLILGLVCFVSAAILLHSFKGRFGEDTAGKMTVNMMPVMEDTIDVSTSAPAAASSSQAVSVVPVKPEAVKEEWVVYITGSVKKPGVYRIPTGSRIYNALEAAAVLLLKRIRKRLIWLQCFRMAPTLNFLQRKILCPSGRHRPDLPSRLPTPAAWV